MGGRGASSGSVNRYGGVGGLTNKQKENIKSGIRTHTKEANGRAESYYKQRMDKEKEVIDNLENYIKSGHIKSKNDKWFKGHEDSYKSLKKQYDYFRKERKKQGR